MAPLTYSIPQNLREAIVQNSKTEFRLAAERKMEEKKKDEEREVRKRQWADQVKRVELRRMKRDMARRREQTTRLKKFYTAKCEVTNEDNSEDEEDEVLDFTKQKAEIIFWNDPRMGMKKKDITLSSLAKSMGIMTIMVTDMEEDKNVKEQHLKLKGNEDEEEVGPLERLKRNGLAEALIRKPQKEKVGLTVPCSYNGVPGDQLELAARRGRQQAAQAHTLPLVMEIHGEGWFICVHLWS